jgi:hypothetical protein
MYIFISPIYIFCLCFLQSPHSWRSSSAYLTSLDLRGSEQLHGCIQAVGIHELMDKFLELISWRGEVEVPCAIVVSRQRKLFLLLQNISHDSSRLKFRHYLLGQLDTPF